MKTIGLLLTFLTEMGAMIFAGHSFVDGEYQMATLCVVIAIYLHGLFNSALTNEKLDEILKKTSKD